MSDHNEFPTFDCDLFEVPMATLTQQDGKYFLLRLLLFSVDFLDLTKVILLHFQSIKCLRTLLIL